MPTQICSHNLRCTVISSLTCGYRTCARLDGTPGFYRIEVPAWPGRVMICSPRTMSEQQAVAWRAGGSRCEHYRSSLLFPDDRARHPALPALRRRPAVSAAALAGGGFTCCTYRLSRWIASASTCSAAAAALGTGSRCWHAHDGGDAGSLARRVAGGRHDHAAGGRSGQCPGALPGDRDRAPGRPGQLRRRRADRRPCRGGGSCPEYLGTAAHPGPPADDASPGVVPGRRGPCRARRRTTVPTRNAVPPGRSRLTWA